MAQVTVTPAWSVQMEAFFDFTRTETEPNRSMVASLTDRAGFRTQARNVSKFDSGAETSRTGTRKKSDEASNGDQPRGASDTRPRHGVAGNLPLSHLSIVSLHAFSGDKVERWIDRCEQYFAANRIDEILRVYIASSHLEDEARNWYHSYCRTRVQASPLLWEEYRAAIMLRFGHASEEAMSRLRVLKQKWSVACYVEQFEALLSKVSYPLRKDQVVDLFLGGLQEEVQTLIKKFRPKSLVEARGLARLQEATNQAKLQISGGFYKEGDIRANTDGSTSGIKEQEEELGTVVYGGKLTAWYDDDHVSTYGNTEVTCTGNNRHGSEVGAIVQKESKDQPRKINSKCDSVPIAGVFLVPVLVAPGHDETNNVSHGNVAPLKSALTGGESVNPTVEHAKLNLKPSSQPSEQPHDTSGLWYGKVRSALEWAQAFSESYLSDPKAHDHCLGNFSGFHACLDEAVTRRWWGKTEQVGSVSVKVPHGTVLEGVAKCKGLFWTSGEVPFTVERYLLPLEGWEMEWGIQGLKKCSLIARKVADDEKATVTAQNTEEEQNVGGPIMDEASVGMGALVWVIVAVSPLKDSQYPWLSYSTIWPSGQG